MDYRVFCIHLWFPVSFSDSVHSKAFTEMSKIYLKSVGKTVTLGARLRNAFLHFFCGYSILVHPELRLKKSLLAKVMGNKAKVLGNEA